MRQLVEDPDLVDSGSSASPARRGSTGPCGIRASRRTASRSRATSTASCRRACRCSARRSSRTSTRSTHEARSVAARGFFALGLSCVVVTRGHAVPAGFRFRGRGHRHAALRDGGALEPHHQRAPRRPRRPPRAPDPAARRPRRRVRRRHPPARQERHRQERVRARARHPRSPPRGRRRRSCATGDRRGRSSGRPAELLRHHIEIRGLGVLDLRELFGITAVRDRKRIDLVVQLLRVERGARSSTDSASRSASTRSWARPSASCASPCARAATWAASSRWRRATSCCGATAGTPRTEFLGRIESHMAMQPVADRGRRTRPRARRLVPPAPRQPILVDAQPQASGTESSAWIPAVRITAQGGGVTDRPPGPHGGRRHRPVRRGQVAGASRPGGPRASSASTTCRRCSRPQAVALCERGGMTRVALGIDVRVRAFLGEVGDVLELLETGGQRDLHVVFLDASDETLLRRFSETRRPHPLSAPADSAQQRVRRDNRGSGRPRRRTASSASASRRCARARRASSTPRTRASTSFGES